jgi:hypothetical protein
MSGRGDHVRIPWPDQRTLARILRRFHLIMTVAWALLLIPTLAWWRDSVLWVALMSVWANLASHFGAWQGTRTEARQIERDADDAAQ